jgi:hypothetical protein
MILRYCVTITKTLGFYNEKNYFYIFYNVIDIGCKKLY